MVTRLHQTEQFELDQALELSKLSDPKLNAEDEDEALLADEPADAVSQGLLTFGYGCSLRMCPAGAGPDSDEHSSYYD
jgi:hypothetical protein